MLLKLMPVVMAVAMIGMIALLISTGGLRNPMMLMFPMMMVMSMVGMLAGSGAGKDKRPAEFDEERKDYFRYLTETRAQVHTTAAEQRAALQWSHPDPAALAALVGSPRMWERGPGDEDFTHVRIGVGDQRLATRLVVPPLGPLEDLEPVAAVSLRRFVHTHAVVPDLPTAVSLRGFAAVGLTGDRAQMRALARAMVLQAALFHGPDDLRIAVAAGRGSGDRWDWIKWLPHAGDPASAVLPGRRALTGALVAELAGRDRFSRAADPLPGRPHLLVVLDDEGADPICPLGSAAGLDGVSVLDLTGPAAAPGARGLTLQVDGGVVGAVSGTQVDRFGRADGVSITQARAVARMLAGYRPAVAGAAGAGPASTAPELLLGIGDPDRFDPAAAWTPRTGRDRLRVPIGVDETGAPVELDLKQAAEGGMGPHGLCVGATGSGKSELLRTLVLGLIATHAPDQLNLVLIDFKGGATFLGLEQARHVAAVITNLEDELSMVDRMHDALSGEMHRRQELLRRAGNFAGVGEYEQARAAGADLDPLPALFVVVDEFSELLSQKPEMAELFVAIGRLGRSLHIHLLLASQRLDEGRLRGLDSHLSYRIGLKTFSATESRAVLGVPDAHLLPARPGAGYLRTDAEDLVRFTAAYVSGPPTAAPESTAGRPVGRHVTEFRTGPDPAERVALAPGPEPVDADLSRPRTRAVAAEPGEERSLLSTVVARLAQTGRAAHRVWLPPLDTLPPVAQIRTGTESGGGPEELTPAIGLIDRPFLQRRDPLLVDLGGAGGSVAIVGGPRSGKSTAAATLVLALAAAHTAAEVQVYALDFGGGVLTGLAGLPHLGHVAGRHDGDAVRRTVAELHMLLAARERGGAGGPERDGFGRVFLVVDGWHVVRGEFDELEAEITDLAVRGLAYRIHVVITAVRWAELRPAIRDVLGTRIELRLGDPMESQIDRRRAETVPADTPGRGLAADGAHMMIAPPWPEGLGAVGRVAELVAAHHGPVAPPVRMLPTDIDYAELLGACGPVTGDDAGVPIGLDEQGLAPVRLDFAAAPHLLVLGDTESGKTSALRAICRGLIAHTAPDRARLVIVDYRRTLLGTVTGDHLAGYAPSAPVLGPMIGHLVQVLRERMPGPDITQAELRRRDWWTGPELYVVVDDYDLVAGGDNPLIALAEFLPQAKDLGLHLIVARRTGGAARALFDPVLGRLRELAADAVVLSGSPEEGALIGGVKARPEPPGRGTWVSRARGRVRVQLARLDQ